MKRRPRRKVAENEEEEIASSCGSPTRDKENFSPTNIKSRQSLGTLQNIYSILLTDFDRNVEMAKQDIYVNATKVASGLTGPFLNVLMKMPPSVKNMKWGDYLKLKNGGITETSIVPVVVNSQKLAVPTGLNLETPAVRSSSRLAKKLPIITPKFDTSTPAAVTKRLPKPGEVLVSLKGSPVAVPQPTPIARSISNLALTDEKNVLMALLSDPETLSNALKDKDTCKAIEKAYKNVKMCKD